MLQIPNNPKNPENNPTNPKNTKKIPKIPKNLKNPMNPKKIPRVPKSKKNPNPIIFHSCALISLLRQYSQSDTQEMDHRECISHFIFD